jgi:drug/metabolite transporter (DMT)-like permease
LTAAGVKPSRAQLYALLGATLLFWSANFIFAKLAIRELPAVLVICLRTILAGALMWPVYAFARPRFESGVRKWALKDVPTLILLGVLGVTGNQLLFIVGLSMTSVAHGSVIMAVSPLLVLLGATLLGQEYLTVPKVTGMLVAASGVAVLQLGRRHSGSTVGGDLIMIASQVVFAGFTVLSKPVVARLGTITVNTFAFGSGAVALLPFAIWDMSGLDLVKVSAVAWTSIAYMAVFPSIAGYLMYTYALRYLPASRVSSVSYLQPVVATLLAVLFLGEQPGIAFAGGAALVMSGVWAAGRH